MRQYYSNYINSLQINQEDRVLDYCSRSRSMAQHIVKWLQQGQLTYAVPQECLAYTSHKLRYCNKAQGHLLDDFSCKIEGGAFEKIILHFVLYNFSVKQQQLVVNQVMKNLKIYGKLFFREPLSPHYGIKLFRLVNMLEESKNLRYTYAFKRQLLLGEFVDIRCHKVPSRSLYSEGLIPNDINLKFKRGRPLREKAFKTEGLYKEKADIVLSSCLN